MPELRSSLLSIGALILLASSSLLSHAGAPPDESLGEGSSFQSEVTSHTMEQYPAEPVTEPMKTELTDDLSDFGITGAPVFSAMAEPIEGTDAPSVSTTATALENPPERIIWNKTPIRITLPVGAERLVHFPADIRIGLPSPPPPGLRTQSIDGTVYWTANEPIPTARVQVQELATGHVYLLDLQAVEGGPSAPVWILRPSAADAESISSDTQSRTNSHPTPAAVTFIQLTRYAAQQLYAPERLVGGAPGIHRIPVKTDPVALIRGGKVEATPLIAWQGGDHYVTGVRLRNTSTQAVILDPRELRGQWHAATFQHVRLFPAGDEADTTCVYLISARPFAESLRGLY